MPKERGKTIFGSISEMIFRQIRLLAGEKSGLSKLSAGKNDLH
jgi:hypothetical protein